MIKNYFNIAVRNFRRYFGYTMINVAGLAVGLATAIFILLWVADELSYDSFHENKNTLYRVWHNANYSDGSIKTFPSTPAPLAKNFALALGVFVRGSRWMIKKSLTEIQKDVDAQTTKRRNEMNKKSFHPFEVKLRFCSE
jgi:putative ABC transport system permease protein